VSRTVTARYVDPLAEVWLGAARRIGLTVVRTQDAYAATDGRGRLAIGADATLDADDSLAQMIFHELCHSLIEGPDSFRIPDWGLDNYGDDHAWREHACLRLQWIIAGRYGLRAVFAPTTDFRALWDTFTGDVLAAREDRAVVLAIEGLRRVGHPPWAPHFEDALAATARIAADAARFALPRPHEAPALWLGVTPAPARHPSGLPAGDHATPGATCGTCAWRHDARGAARCRQAEARVDPAWPGCERYEPPIDCQTCGACCRAAYHSVEVSRRDPMVKRQPGYVVDHGTRLEVLRDGDRCACLAGGVHVDASSPVAATRTRFHCTIYDDRPRTCREFTLGSAHCLTARRRVGLSL
jgi:Fe-S-cluster containining protein